MSWACSQYGQYAPGGAHHGWGGAGHSHLAVHHHPYSAHVPGPPPSGVTPGDLHGRPRRGRSRSKSSRARSRSRSPRRVKSSVKTVRASDLKMDLGKEAFSKLVLECLLLLSPEEFGDIWVSIPRQLRAVAWRPPPGVVVDIDSLKGAERIQMCAKLNALRRERCVQLASPKQQPHFEDENCGQLLPFLGFVVHDFGNVSACFL